MGDTRQGVNKDCPWLPNDYNTSHGRHVQLICIHNMLSIKNMYKLMEFLRPGL